MAEERPRKIALIGAAGYEYASPEARVECFAWDRLQKVANLADYDAIVLNLHSIEDPGSLGGEAFMKVLNVRIMLEVLATATDSRGDGGIFVLGDPKFNIVETSSGRSKQLQHRWEVPFLFWTGLRFKWDDRPGDTIERGWEAVSGPFKPFADKLGRWRYSLDECDVDPDALSEFFPLGAVYDAGNHLVAYVNDICRSRYHTSIVFSVHIAVKERTPRYAGHVEQTEVLMRPIYFLPESQLSQEETLDFVLRNLCDVDVSAPEPEWISGFVAPGQEGVDCELVALTTRVEELIEEHDRKVEERAGVREPLKLLYETGMTLEEAVWSVLESLGAEVERPEERTNEDGWVTVRGGDEIFEGVLEVKGVKSKYFDKQGLRQLTEWIERGWTFRDKTYTGIFVGNSSREDPPRRRVWPFHRNWVEDARRRGYAAIRSEDLYVVYLLNRTGRLDRDGFWRELFSTTGPFDMRPYREKLTVEEKGQLENLPQA